jgi:hypothetical protein
MKLKIVKLEIKDYDLVGIVEYPNGVLDTKYLINPDENKLAELKHMIEHRFDYQFDDTFTAEEIFKAEKFCDSIWHNIDKFIEENFVVLDIDETYKIAY